MIVSAINNSYSALQTASRWYWSAPTQQSLIDFTNNVREIITITLLLLSQCYADFLGLIDTWLTPDCDQFVVIGVCDNTVSWNDVRGWLLADLAYVEMWLGFFWSDAVNTLMEYYYRVKVIL